MKTLLHTITLITALSIAGTSLAQPAVDDGKDPVAQVVQDEVAPEDFDLERDESGNWINNGMERLLKESEAYVTKRNLEDRLNSALNCLGLQVTRDKNTFIIHY